MNKLQIKTALQVVIIFIAPLLLITLNIISPQYRLVVLLIVAILVTLVIVIEKWTLKDLGIRLDNFKRGVWWYLGLTVASLVVIAYMCRVLNHNTQNILNNIHFQYLFLIASFAQEFLFRSFLIPKLKNLFSSPLIIIILNGLLFGFIHIIYPNPLSLFILSSLLGTGFAFVYYYRPNLILATIAHAIINFTAVFYCFASFSAICR